MVPFKILKNEKRFKRIQSAFIQTKAGRIFHFFFYFPLMGYKGKKPEEAPYFRKRFFYLVLEKQVWNRWRRITLVITKETFSDLTVYRRKNFTCSHRTHRRKKMSKFCGRVSFFIRRWQNRAELIVINVESSGRGRRNYYQKM